MTQSDRPRRSLTPSPSSEPAPKKPPVIVVADDDRVTRDTICEMLRRQGYEVAPSLDGQEAVELVGQGGVDLVLLDILMPRLGGIEACRIIKGMTSEGFVPVVLVTVKTDTASRVEGLKIGADDYVTKPFEERELLARVEAMLRIKRLNDHLVAVRQKLERLSVYDEQTGLYNFRYLHTRLNEEFKRAERYHELLSCVVIDVRAECEPEQVSASLLDVIVRGVSEIVRRSVREVDVVARYGGQEFLVILPSTNLAGAVAVGERVCREVRGKIYVGERGGSPVRATVAVGVALYPAPEVKTKEALVRAADAALSQAKREGGNRVCVFHQGPDSSAGFGPASSPPPNSADR